MLLKIFSFFFFCSSGGAVKKYPKNRMLGNRQVTDGKVKSSHYIFYFDCKLLVNFLIRLLTCLSILRFVSGS